MGTQSYEGREGIFSFPTFLYMLNLLKSKEEAYGISVLLVRVSFIRAPTSWSTYVKYVSDYAGKITFKRVQYK